jgi:hypothetical protein
MIIILKEFTGTNRLSKKKGNVPIWPLTSNSNNHPPPLAPALPPWGAGAHAIPLYYLKSRFR